MVAVTGVVANAPADAPAGSAAAGVLTVDANGVAVTGSEAVGTTAAPTGSVRAGVLTVRASSVAVEGQEAVATGAAPAGSATVGIDRTEEGVLQLSLLDTSVQSQPGVLRVNVGNGTPYGPVYFFLDATVASFTSSTLDEDGGLVVVSLPINGLSVGTHTVRAAQADVNPGSGPSFEVLQAAAPFDTPPVGQVPPLVVEPTNHWVFQAYDFSDLASVDTYVFPLNPEKISTSFGKLNITTEQSTSADGVVMSWEGAPRPEIWSWSGRVLAQADLEALRAWSETGQRIWLTDHLQRRFLVKVATLKLEPVRDPARPWHHSYVMTAWALSGDGIRT